MTREARPDKVMLGDRALVDKYSEGDGPTTSWLRGLQRLGLVELGAGKA
jgi:hypothetical protein